MNWEKYKYYYIALSVTILLVVMAVIYFIKRRNMKTGDNDILGKEQNSVGTFKGLVEKKDTLFSLTTKKDVNLIIVIGGINFATPKWMYSQLNENFKNNCFIGIAPYNVNYDLLKEQIKDITKENNYVIKKTAIIGYSAGGHLIQKKYNKAFDFVGLIDPSTAPNYLTQSFSGNVFMLYNDKNWGGYPTIKKTLPLLHDKIISSGGKSSSIAEGHSKIPLLFFNKYENELIS